MTRLHRPVLPSGCVVLLADDDPEYLEATRLLLAAEGHEVLTADSGPAALGVLREREVDLVLLDYFMPGMNGEEVVSRLREFDPRAQVVLQTGYSEEQPPRSLLRRLDIQGYFDKSEGPERLLLWTDSALKASREIGRLHRVATVLRRILDAAPKPHDPPAQPQLLDAALGEASNLAGLLAGQRRTGAPQTEAARVDALIALGGAGGDLVPVAGTGRYAELGAAPPQLAATLRQVAEAGAPRALEDASLVPIRAGDRPLGALLVGVRLARPELELLRLFADQLAIALEVGRRRPFDRPEVVEPGAASARALRLEVRAAICTARPLTLALLRAEARASRPPEVLTALLPALRPGDRLLASEAQGHVLLLLPNTAARGAARLLRRVLATPPPVTPDGAATRWRAGAATLSTHRWPRDRAAADRAAVTAHVTDLLERARAALLAAEPRAGVALVVAPER